MKKIIIFFIYFYAFISLHAEFLTKEIIFKVKHPFKNVRGICKEIQIEEIQIDNNLNVKSFRIVIPYLKMDTGNQNRDSHMLEVLGYPKYKEIVVEVNSFIVKDNITFEGWITIKGIRKPFTSNATIEKKDNLFIVKGKRNILLSEYDIERPSLLGLSIEDLVEIEYNFIYKH